MHHQRIWGWTIVWALLGAGCTTPIATNPDASSLNQNSSFTCSCSTSCCSAQNVDCTDGSSCTGSYFCNYQTGKCQATDPCDGNSNSGQWSCVTELAPSCRCSTSCCSAQNVACTDGSVCAGGYYCDYQSGKCQQVDPCNGKSGSWSCPDGGSSGGSNGGTSGGSSGGAGGVGPNGGVLPSLVFSLIGDTRPATSDDVAGYPTAIVANSFHNMATASPAPAFAIASGDFMYSDDSTDPSASTALQQAALYMDAVVDAGFSNQLFLALGNHECNTATTSNCGSGNSDGVTPNYSAFLGMLTRVGLGGSDTNPIPYYTVNVKSSAGVAPAWTAKFVVMACNAWDDTQQSWLQSAMQVSTTYTFIVRHETVEEDQEPGVPASPCGLASSAILASYANAGQITLLLTGHTHYYKINDQPTDVVSGGAPGVTLNVPEIVAGNGGAPLRSDATDYGADGYGYVICGQTPGSNASQAYDIACQEYDATSGSPSSAPGAYIQVTASGAIVIGGGADAGPSGTSSGGASTGTTGSASSSGGASSGGAPSGTSTGSGTGSSSSAGGSSSGGSSGGGTLGSSGTSGTSSGGSAGGSTTGGAGGSSGGFPCSCSTSCCSAADVTCTDGTACTGGYYCNYQTGKCAATDPCAGASGNWSCCGCSSSCCSAKAVTCTDGSTCTGSYYCSYQTGKCVSTDPCGGASGSWSCSGG